MSADDRLDRETHPELNEVFDALDRLVAPPADSSLRVAQIQRAAATARSAVASPPVAVAWRWRRAASWRVAAVAAAAVAVIAGLGADDRLPAPAQRVVSSVAEVVGVDVPDGSSRANDAEDAPDLEDLDESPDTSGKSGTTPATPGGPGEPATPAEPGNGNGNGAEPATPAEPGSSEGPASPATATATASRPHRQAPRSPTPRSRIPPARRPTTISRIDRNFSAIDPYPADGSGDHSTAGPLVAYRQGRPHGAPAVRAAFGRLELIFAPAPSQRQRCASPGT